MSEPTFAQKLFVLRSACDQINSTPGRFTVAVHDSKNNRYRLVVDGRAEVEAIGNDEMANRGYEWALAQAGKQ